MADNFLDVPYIHCAREAFWRELLVGRSTTLRIAVIGDSQETTPLGFGDGYAANMMRETFLRYGNLPETSLCSSASSTGNTAGMFSPCRVEAASGVALTTATNKRPPGMGHLRYATTNGWTMALMPDVPLAADQTLRGSTFWPKTADTAEAHVYFFSADYIGASSDDECAYGTATTNNIAFVSGFPGGSTSSGLDLSTTSDPFRTLEVPVVWGAEDYFAVNVRGTSATGVEVLGGRFVNTANPAGVVFDWLASGGYQVTSFITNHANCGPLMVSMGYGAVMLTFGANDAYNGDTAETYKSDIASLIATLRGASFFNDPNLPIIVIPDPYVRTDPGHSNYAEHAAEWLEHQEYPGVIKELIDEGDDYLLLVNSLRLLYETGWSQASSDLTVAPGSMTEWSSDSVSYVVGDLRKLTPTGNAPVTYWECQIAHTSSAANGPGAANSYQWKQMAAHLAVNDVVHYSALGARRKAQADASLLFDWPEPARTFLVLTS
jgi:hypothetical protein